MNEYAIRHGLYTYFVLRRSHLFFLVRRRQYYGCIPLPAGHCHLVESVALQITGDGKINSFCTCNVYLQPKDTRQVAGQLSFNLYEGGRSGLEGTTINATTH